MRAAPGVGRELMIKRDELGQVGEDHLADLLLADEDLPALHHFCRTKWIGRSVNLGAHGAGCTPVPHSFRSGFPGEK